MTQETVSHFRQELNQLFKGLQDQGLWRVRPLLASPTGAVVHMSGNDLVNFSSNDYLGLAHHDEIIRAMAEGAEKYGTGSGASPLVCGYSSVHKELEDRVCLHTGRERALLFTSGYLANLAIITSLASRGDRVICDRLNHASLNDAARLSGARIHRFQHADVSSLARILNQADSRALVASDSLFSMDGDTAPLAAIASLCSEHDALLVVDEAHAFGVYGENGNGVLEQENLSQEHAPLMMGTFGKALGTSGAFVAGDKMLIEQLIQSARSYIYTTAPSPAIIAATLKSFELLSKESWRRDLLQKNIDEFRRGAASRKIPVLDSATAIQPIILESTQRVLSASAQLIEKGLLVGAIRPPTVPEGSSRLRIVLTANHTQKQIRLLLDSLGDLFE